MVLKELHCFFMFLGRASAGEGSEIAAPPGLGILLARVQTILAGF
jgi:hypothetical protein